MKIIPSRGFPVAVHIRVISYSFGYLNALSFCYGTQIINFMRIHFSWADIRIHPVYFSLDNFFNGLLRMISRYRPVRFSLPPFARTASSADRDARISAFAYAINEIAMIILSCKVFFLFLSHPETTPCFFGSDISLPDHVHKSHHKSAHNRPCHGAFSKIPSIFYLYRVLNGWYH